jgi:hypothetical protein
VSVLLRTLRGGEREHPALSFEEYVSWFTFGGLSYPIAPRSTLQQEREETPETFAAYITQLYYQNGIVFAVMAMRQRVFSQARLQWQRLSSVGSPGDLFGSPELAPLEHPWGPSSTTSDLLGRMIQDADLGGSGFVARLPGGRLAHMRPDWVTVVAGSKSSADRNPNWQLDAEVIGYIYWPGGKYSGVEPEMLLPENVCHFAPHPDPLARFTGMSWLTPIVREILGDKAAMQHKLMFFEQGATPNLVVSIGENVTPENFMKFTELFEEQQEGVMNAYKTLFFGGGANVEVVGANLRQLDFKTTQGQGETRIAAAGGVPPIIPGFSEGLEAATYSNYGQARRAFADTTMAHLWINACASLEPLVDKPAPSGRNTGSPVRLWYDSRSIPFLQADVEDDAKVQQMHASTINTLITAGFTPDDVIKAVVAGDLRTLIGSHSGLVSVQLFKPGEGPAKDTPPPAAVPVAPPNGKPAAQPALPPPPK